MTPSPNELAFSWVSNFIGNHGDITQVIYKCKMLTSLSKMLTCYSVVFIKALLEKFANIYH